ncbi:MFS transporter [Nocardia sp. GCM10030253]|uniref:MFS transporter n=1 Tax=Nocardia sp. GCM10030253 TaxID=3273404 RepID=UPI00363CD63B
MNANTKTLTRRYVVLNVLGWLPTGLCAPVLVLLLAARGIDVATMGTLLAAYGLTAACLELPTGGIADVLGRRPVLVAASVLFLLATLLVGLGTSILVIAAGILLEAVGRALDSGPLQAWYVDAVRAVDKEADLTAAFAKGRAAGSVALAIGALVGGGVAGGALAGWMPLPTGGDAPILALSLPYLLAAGIVVLRALTQVAWVAEAERRPRAVLRTVLADIPRTVRDGVVICTRNSVLRRITVLCGVIGVVLATVELLAPLWIAELLGGNGRAVVAYAVFTALGGFAMAAGASMSPTLTRFLGSVRRTVVAALIVAAIAVAALGAPIFPLAAAGYVCVYLALGAPEPLLDAFTHRAATSRERATVLSVQSLAMRLCGSAGALVAGLLAANTSIVYAWALVIGVLGVGALVAVGLSSSDRSSDEPANASAEADAYPSPALERV